MLRAEAAAEPGRYDLVHAHYWLSGKVGAAAKERWGVPLVQSMHTLGKVKNAALAAGETAEPTERISGELDVIAAADRLIANTAEEARQLTELYDADPAKVQTVNPGADLSVFQPGGRRSPGATPERDSASRQDAVVLLFVGRVQPLKGPDVVLKTAAKLIEASPELRRTLRVVLVGGPSGRQQRADPDGMRELAAHLGISENVRFEPPCPQAELAQWYRAATVVLTPSHSESFGLVALEAQACGTPVVAARVGGLRTVVSDGVLRRPGGRARPGRLGPGRPAPHQGAGAAPGPVGGRPTTRVRFRLVRDRGPAGQGVYRCHGRGGCLPRGPGQGVSR